MMKMKLKMCGERDKRERESERERAREGVREGRRDGGREREIG
jgi:hypothetical protein